MSDQAIDLEKSKVGLYAVLSILPIVASLTFFISFIYFKAEASETRLAKYEDEKKAHYEMIVELKNNVAVLTAIVERLEKSRQ